MQLTMNPAIADARDTFDALLQAHRKIVFKVAASYASGVEDRADLAQEIAVQLWRAYPAYNESRSFGIAGLAATWWFHRWSRDPSRPRLARTVQDSVTGRSLRSAQAVLDEVAAFEKD